MEGAGRSTLARRQHPPPLRTGGQPVHRPGPQARRDAVLLHPQAHAHQGVRRLRRAAGRVRHAGRGVRAAHPAADGQGRACPARAARRPRAAPTGGAGARFVEEEVAARGLVSRRRPLALPGHRRRGRGRRRAPRLLPQLPLVPLGGRPAGHAPAPGAHAAAAGRAQRRVSPTSWSAARSGRPSRWRRSARATTTSSCPGSPSGSTACTTAGLRQLIDADQRLGRTDAAGRNGPDRGGRASFRSSVAVHPQQRRRPSPPPGGPS